LPTFLVFVAAFIVGAPRASAGAQKPACLTYEPDTVQVSGRLVRRMYYGAPNFGEDTATDEKEIYFYLELPAEVCTMERDEVDNARQHVRLVQLVLDSAGYERLRPRLKQNVTLRGTLFASFDGHHHAPLLLNVLSPVRPVVAK
jgi:hypothetical protein